MNDANTGNFLELIKLLSRYDSVLQQHLEMIQTHPAEISYLSPKIQNEFINILATSTLQKLLHSIKKAKYFAMIADSTPDKQHRDQLSLVIRYEKKNGFCKRIFSWIY